ncbi:hypothetical protein EVAR_59631_1 [Eumeta japonica]|uniref:Uncharacterized protein n=1 Tax=Eumeta variegata TaxID=151549 RepID=A0A4C1YF35_EUMVA|nr:hypothetical protein EVAR_59631_1 [Eumeta japonica]
MIPKQSRPITHHVHDTLVHGYSEAKKHEHHYIEKCNTGSAGAGQATPLRYSRSESADEVTFSGYSYVSQSLYPVCYVGPQVALGARVGGGCAAAVRAGRAARARAAGAYLSLFRVQTHAIHPSYI